MAGTIDSPFVYFIGTAGAGKSRLTAAMQRWMTEQQHDSVVVNLDPGAEELPYVPDVDIRDWIRLDDVMVKYGLGPNGAQVAAADMLAVRAGELVEILEGFETDYYLLDTPGQTELFVYREAGKFLVEALSERPLIAFCVDPFLAKDANGFAAQLLLCATTQFRFRTPVLNVLTKTDLVKDEDLQRIRGWSDDIDTLYDALTAKPGDTFQHLNTATVGLLKEFGTYAKLTPTSAETFEGLDDLYTVIQQNYMASEDLARR